MYADFKYCFAVGNIYLKKLNFQAKKYPPSTHLDAHCRFVLKVKQISVISFISCTDYTQSIFIWSNLCDRRP